MRKYIPTFESFVSKKTGINESKQQLSINDKLSKQDVVDALDTYLDGMKWDGSFDADELSDTNKFNKKVKKDIKDGMTIKEIYGIMMKYDEYYDADLFHDMMAYSGYDIKDASKLEESNESKVNETYNSKKKNLQDSSVVVDKFIADNGSEKNAAEAIKGYKAIKSITVAEPIGFEAAIMSPDGEFFNLDYSSEEGLMKETDLSLGFAVKFKNKNDCSAFAKEWISKFGEVHAVLVNNIYQSSGDDVAPTDNADDIKELNVKMLFLPLVQL
jgi:hypothetical protein